MTQSEIGDILKKLVTNKDDKFKHKLYVDSVSHAKEMAVHMYGHLPVDLLERVRPHEDPAITQYRLESYEPTTTSTAEKAVTIVKKIFHPGNYSINFNSDKNSQELKEVTLSEYPIFNSVVTYLNKYALKKVIADPNGIFVVQPYNYQIKDTERVQPFMTAYPSCDVWERNDDFVLVFLNHKEEKKTKYWDFQFIDKESIVNYRLTSSNSTNYVVEELSRYNHLFGELPVWSCGGSYDQDKPGLFESFFSAAVPFWNKAINAESDLDGAYVKHMNPQKWETADECEYVATTEFGNYACQSGYIFDSHEGTKSKCPSCNGFGRKSLTGPYDTAWVAKDKFPGGENASTIPIPPFGYVTVPTEATAMLEKRVDALLEKGLNAMNMDVVNKIGENQSGVAKTIDRTELNDFLGNIRDWFFDIHLTNFFYFSARYMFDLNGITDTKDIQPQIIKPQTFDVYNTTELTEQLKAGKDAGLSPSYLQTKQQEIQAKEFQQNPTLLNKLNLETILDPFPGKTSDEIIAMDSIGSVLRTDIIIHDNIIVFVQRALEENKGFQDLDLMKQREILTKYAQEIVEENKVTINEVPTVDQNGLPIIQNNLN